MKTFKTLDPMTIFNTCDPYLGDLSQYFMVLMLWFPESNTWTATCAFGFNSPNVSAAITNACQSVYGAITVPLFNPLMKSEMITHLHANIQMALESWAYQNDPESDGLDFDWFSPWFIK